MLFVVSFLVAAALVAARDCAPVPLEAQYWQPASQAATAAANNVEGTHARARRPSQRANRKKTKNEKKMIFR